MPVTRVVAGQFSFATGWQYVLGPTSVAQLSSFATITGDSGGADPREAEAQIIFRLEGAGGALNFSARVGGAQSVHVLDIGMTSKVVLTGTVNNDILYGSAYADTLNGGTGADVMGGGGGNDTYYVDNIADQLSEFAGEGIDTVRTTLSSYALGAGVERLVFTGVGNFVGTGNALANRLTGGAGNDTLNGGDGNDLLNGGTGADAMAGGAGNDAYYVDNADDTVTESAGGGIDTIRTTLSSYTLGTEVERVMFIGVGNFVGTGNALANRLTGGAGNDTLDGGDGNDSLNGGAGADAMTGGAGNDTYYVDTVGDTVTEITGGGIDTVRTTLSSYTLGTEVDRVMFTGSGDFVGIGNALANRLTGGAGTDTLDGGDGNDLLNGGAGADAMTGGAGNDIYYVDDISDTVAEIAGGGIDTVLTTLSTYTLGTEVDRVKFTGVGNFVGTGNALANGLTGGAGDDTLEGGAGNDSLNGGAGADAMTGGAGNDTYYVDTIGDTVTEIAGGGIDTVRTTLSTYTLGTEVDRLVFTGSGDFVGTGNALANVLTGGAGNDTLDGGDGKDTLHAGAGNDTIVGAQNDALLDGGANIDTLQVAANFTSTGDRQIINIENVALTAAVTLNLANQTEGFAITGSSGVDSITGGSGDDEIRGAQNDTLLDGGAGTGDVLHVGADFTSTGDGQIANIEFIVIRAATVIDFANQTEGFTFIGADDLRSISVTGGSGADRILTNGGKDTIVGAQNDLRLDGGADTDTLQVGANFTSTGDSQIVNIERVLLTQAVTLNLANQTEGFTITGSSGADSITGSPGIDSITGGSGDDEIRGAQNDALLDGGEGTDILRLGAAFASTADVQIVNIESVQLYAPSALNLVNQTEAFTITGSSGADSITGGSGNDVIAGGAGADAIDGGAGSNTFVINAVVGSSSDSSRVVVAGNGNDTGQDTITGFNLTNDTLKIVATNVAGFAHGLYTATVGTGFDFEDGTTASFTTSTGLVDLNGADFSFGDAGDIAVTFTAPTGGAFSADAFRARLQYDLTGTSGADYIVTSGLNDTIKGGGGVDYIDSGGGADTIIVSAVVGSSSDSTRVIRVGNGNDTGQDILVDFAYASDILKIVATNVSSFVHGADTAIGTAGGVHDGTAASFTTKIGLVDLNQTTDGFDDAGDIAVTFDDQILFPFGRAESVFEGLLAYDLTGTSGADTITTGARDDRIQGGGGADILNGGSGNDVFVFAAAGDSTAARVRHDCWFCPWQRQDRFCEHCRNLLLPGAGRRRHGERQQHRLVRKRREHARLCQYDCRQRSGWRRADGNRSRRHKFGAHRHRFPFCLDRPRALPKPDSSKGGGRPVYGQASGGLSRCRQPLPLYVPWDLRRHSKSGQRAKRASERALNSRQLVEGRQVALAGIGKGGRQLCRPVCAGRVHVVAQMVTPAADWHAGGQREAAAPVANFTT